MTEPAFRSFDNVQAYLDKLGMFHMDFGLDRIQRALKSLNLERQHCYTVQVLGTNGKGSTASFLASLCKDHGLNVGVYTSPHFVTPRERVRVKGHMLSPSVWTELANEVYAAATDLTYFEFLTVLGYLGFAKAKVDVAIMEAGLGGLHDATTALPADLLCYTPISFDHQQVLGSTLSAIAADKAGAIRGSAPVCTAPQEAEAFDALQRASTSHSAMLYQAAAFDSEKLGLAGPHQKINAGLALQAWDHISKALNVPTVDSSVTKGLQQAHIAGRLQWYAPFLLDGAHNEQGLIVLRDALSQAGLVPDAVVFSCLADKDLDTMLPLLKDVARGAPLYIPTIQDNERAMIGNELAIKLRQFGMRADGFERLGSALEALQLVDFAQAGANTSPSKHPIRYGQPRKLVLVCGSLYLLGEWFTFFPEALDS